MTLLNEWTAPLCAFRITGDGIFVKQSGVVQFIAAMIYAMKSSFSTASL
jgi:hypothetical protein